MRSGVGRTPWLLVEVGSRCTSTTALATLTLTLSLMGAKSRPDRIAAHKGQITSILNIFCTGRAESNAGDSCSGDWWRNLKDASHATSLRKQSHLSGEDKDGGIVVSLTLAGDDGMP